MNPWKNSRDNQPARRHSFPTGAKTPTTVATDNGCPEKYGCPQIRVPSNTGALKYGCPEDVGALKQGRDPSRSPAPAAGPTGSPPGGASHTGPAVPWIKRQARRTNTLSLIHI